MENLINSGVCGEKPYESYICDQAAQYNTLDMCMTMKCGHLY